MHGNVFEWCRDWYHAALPGGVDPDVQVKGRAEPRRQLLARPARRRVERRRRVVPLARCACATSPSATPITSGSASRSSLDGPDCRHSCPLSRLLPALLGCSRRSVLAAIMSRRVTPLVALIALPVRRR
jgi:formylglycine-generating enzyme required for sulfatase activity